MTPSAPTEKARQPIRYHKHGLMRFSFPVGRLFGTQIRIHLTLLFFLVWVFLEEAQDSTWGFAWKNVFFLLLVFTSVLLHEFGHVLAARRFGIATPDITLMPIGGMARLEKIPEIPRQEIAVALAGPAVSAALGISLWTLTGFGNVFQATVLEKPGTLVPMLSSVNFGLLLFNLLPAFPMDGGRVLRACLAFRFSYVQSTQWASQVGKGIAMALFVCGMLLPLPMLSILAVFLYLSAARETAVVTRRQAAPDAPETG